MFVTVTVRAPGAAELETVMLTVRWVEFVRVTELTVTLFGVNVTDEVGHDPLRKFEPVMTMFWLVAPCARELGLSDVIVGAEFTVKALARVPWPRFGLRTVTLREPVAASGAIEMLTVRWVEFVQVTELTVIPAPENETEPLVQVPLRKFEPVMTMFWFVAPRPRELGLSDVIVGAAAIARQFVQVADNGPGFVTVTLRLLMVAPLETVMLAVRLVALLKAVELTVTPVPETATADVGTKPVPVIVTRAVVAPRPSELGFAPVTVSETARLTVKVWATCGAGP
jgi:hypothetical protein